MKYFRIFRTGTGSPSSSLPLGVVNIRRPSISAPIKKNTPAGRIVHSPTPDDEPRCSTPKRICDGDVKESSDDRSRIKEEMEFEQEDEKKGVDAESNTTHSGEYCDLHSNRIKII